MEPLLEIRDLHVSIDGKKILNGVNLSILEGSIHAIMGPNGAGKSTLGKVIAGHPSYEVIEGEILYKGQNILEMEPEERSNNGLFLGFQYPVEIAGVSNRDFLKAALNAKYQFLEKPLLTEDAFSTLLEKKMKQMEMDFSFKERNLNEGFSGGEKKRNEILQMLILEPTLAILDETDSGLDIDAMKVVANGVNLFRNQNVGLVLITHYQRLLEYIKPDYVHVMLQGKIVRTEGAGLALKLEDKGYDWLT